MSSADAMPLTVLVTGVTGYIGHELVRPLLDAGYRVRALTRSAEKLDDAPFRDEVEVVEADISEPGHIDDALADVDIAYYLVHSMDDEGDFERRDLELAASFAAAAERAGVSRIIYLGGLHPDDDDLSPHLRSRAEVGRVFLDSSVPAVCLQAGVVLGAGSASFQMIHRLAERLPVLVAPRWLHNRIQPIAVDDVTYYLVACAALPAEVNRTFDIGGPDVMTYVDMIQRFWLVAGQPRRVVVPVPISTTELAGYGVALLTPIEAGLARPLVGSLVHEVVCKEHDIAQFIPDPIGGLIPFDEAVEEALVDLAEG